MFKVPRAHPKALYWAVIGGMLVVHSSGTSHTAAQSAHGKPVLLSFKYLVLIPPQLAPLKWRDRAGIADAVVPRSPAPDPCLKKTWKAKCQYKKYQTNPKCSYLLHQGKN